MLKMENKIINKRLTSGEMDQLENANTPKKWLQVHDSILDDRGGHYPPDWTEKTLELFVKLIENL